MLSSVARSKPPRRPLSWRSPPIPPPDGTDILSSFPREMLEEILRRLPIDDAVRTSVLAKNWRCRWATCPGLQFIFFEDDGPAAVEAVLAGYASPVGEFEVHVPEESVDKVHGWLRDLSAKGVRCLKLYFIPADVCYCPVLPCTLFSCRELTTLVLKYCTIPALPASFQGFPNLADLQLDEIRLPEQGGRTLEALIEMSPSLCSLDIQFPAIESDDYGNYSEWAIRAPNLKFFDIRSEEDFGWTIEDLPSIEEAKVDLEGPQLVRIISRLSRVKKLHIDFAQDTTVDRLPSYFLDLKDLSFDTLFTMSYRISSILCILRNAPNLEHLQITILPENNESSEVDMEFLNAQPSLGMFSGLKSFRLYAIRGRSNEMQFIEFVLSKAAHLQKIEVSVHDQNTKSMEVVSSELAKYKKASPHAEVIVNRFLCYCADETDDEEP